VICEDRSDAGRRLAEALQSYDHNKDAIVIALPRGGVVVGYEVALALHLTLDIVCPRKIGAPFNPELAIGAVTETGECILSSDLISELGVSENFIQKEIEQEKKKAQWRLASYRKDRSARVLQDKIVILIDDGLATGATMLAAIKTVRSENAKEIIMAIPVAPEDTLIRLEKEVDQTICLASPMTFYAVGQFYRLFDQTTDEEVITLLKKNHNSVSNSKI
jgi:putative phosphoribosyl transferase